MQNKKINSNGYWDSRFLVDWESFQGPMQSRFFARLAIEKLPHWLMDQLRQNSLTLCDWGCAQGDGADVWAGYMASERITGVDFSSVAIAQAAQRYPTLKFVNEDWLNADSDNRSFFDVVFSSNTLEHFHKPYDVLENICGHATKALVLAIPYRELDRHQEHFYTFLPENIPTVISGNFRLVWSKVVNCRSIVNTYWPGEQIILVYANSSWVDDIGLTLDDCRIEADDFSDEIKKLKYLEMQSDKLIVRIANNLSDRSAQIAGLKQEVADRDSQLAILKQEVADRDSQLANFKQQVTDRDNQLAHLKREVAERDNQLAHLKREVTDRDNQLAHLKQEVAERDGQLSKLKVNIDRQDAQIAGLQSSLMIQEKRNAEFLTSMSWRITYPIRFLKDFFYSFGNKRLQYEILKSIYGIIPGCLRLKLRKPAQKIYLKYLADAVGVYENEKDSDEKNIPWIARINAADRILVISCGFEFDDLVNQRPINAAKHYAEKGWLVIYIAWQWSPKEVLSKGCGEVFPNIIQVPLYDFLNNYTSICLTDKIGKYIITMPSLKLVQVVDVWRSKGGVVIYDIMDEWEEFFRVGQAPWYEKQIEKNLVLKSDYVSAVSPALCRKFESIRKDIAVIGNGYSRNLLGMEKRGIAIEREKHSIVVGYFGHLTDAWFDWSLLLNLASKTKNYKYEIIGYGEPAWVRQKLVDFENISFIGKVHPSELHSYASNWTVGLIPFVESELSKSVDPIKIYEYLYFGLRVVVTGIEHLDDYPNTFFSEKSAIKETLLRAVETAIDPDNLNDFLEETTWSARFDQLMMLSEEKSGIFSLYEK